MSSEPSPQGPPPLGRLSFSLRFSSFHLVGENGSILSPSHSSFVLGTSYLVFDWVPAAAFLSRNGKGMCIKQSRVRSQFPQQILASLSVSGSILSKADGLEAGTCHAHRAQLRTSSPREHSAPGLCSESSFKELNSESLLTQLLF